MKPHHQEILFLLLTSQNPKTSVDPVTAVEIIETGIDKKQINQENPYFALPDKPESDEKPDPFARTKRTMCNSSKAILYALLTSRLRRMSHDEVVELIEHGCLPEMRNPFLSATITEKPDPFKRRKTSMPEHEKPCPREQY